MRYRSKAIGTAHRTFFKMKCAPIADNTMLPMRMNFMAFSFQLKFENLKEISGNVEAMRNAKSRISPTRI
jgi:hypothetical protein